MTVGSPSLVVSNIVMEHFQELLLDTVDKTCFMAHIGTMMKLLQFARMGKQYYISFFAISATSNLPYSSLWKWKLIILLLSWILS
jgi:hypothetical protein